ncbi:hypothetical protein ACFZB5_13715 [Streptomyces nodosus]|uniref:hypothetical protein n=1 Tax=Streptomyces nodosus TaxID=40318 RepID=UPI0036EE0D41
MTDTRWNGEPCQARRITALVADDARFPAYWARHLAGTRRHLVEVEYGGETFYLDDEDGSGWHKVTHGGSPRWAHSNITIKPDSIQPVLTCSSAHFLHPHGPHSWEPQPGMDPVYCEGYSQPAAPQPAKAHANRTDDMAS